MPRWISVRTLVPRPTVCRRTGMKSIFSTVIFVSTACGHGSPSWRAAATVFTKLAVPEMIRYGYDKRFAVGVVAGSSVLGMLIPPSVLFIIYGLITNASVGDLFLAGGAIEGLYEAEQPGHALNNQLLRAVFADATAFAWT